MNEFSRWMRYMLPGSVVALHFLIALYIVFPNRVEKSISLFVEVDAIASLAGLLLGTGALGFIFSTLYYTFRNWKWTFLFYDHMSVLIDLRKEYNVMYRFVGNAARGMSVLCEQQQLERLKVRQRWELFNLIWHSEKNDSVVMQRIEPIAQRMHAVAHGLGTTMFGLIVSMISYLCLTKRINGEFEMLDKFLLIWLIPIACFLVSYYRANKSVGKLYDDSLRFYFADEIRFCHNRRYFFSPNQRLFNY